MDDDSPRVFFIIDAKVKNTRGESSSIPIPQPDCGKSGKPQDTTLSTIVENPLIGV